MFASLLAACTRLSQSTHRAASSAQHITAATAFSHASHWTFILSYLFLSVPPPRPRTRAPKCQMPHLQSSSESPPLFFFCRPLHQMPRRSYATTQLGAVLVVHHISSLGQSQVRLLMLVVSSVRQDSVASRPDTFLLTLSTQAGPQIRAGYSSREITSVTMLTSVRRCSCGIVVSQQAFALFMLNDG